MTTSSPVPFPAIDIRLPSGLHLRDVGGMLRRKFDMWPWGNYDGLVVNDPFAITDNDVDISFSGIGARSSVNRDVYKAQIREKLAELNTFLREIPSETMLEDLDLAEVRGPIVGLIDCLTDLKGVKIANATKITHRHRPGLLPIVDSVLENYYKYAISIRDECRFQDLKRARTQSWGMYYLAILDQIREDIRATTDQLDQLRQEIAGTEYAGASRLRILESLIWYYYAG